MEYKLIYVNRLGYNYKGLGTFEMIFCDDSCDLDDVWGEGWEAQPAQGIAQPPQLEFVSKVGTLKVKEYDMMVIQDHEFFSVDDATQDIIALAYEIIDEDFDPKNKRLVFRYGETLDSVEKKIKKRGLKIVYED